MRRPAKRRWCLPLAFLVSGAVHLGLALALLWPQDRGGSTGASDGDQVVGVTLAMFGKDRGDSLPMPGATEESTPDSAPGVAREPAAEEPPSPAVEPKTESEPEPRAEPESLREGASLAAPPAAETEKASPEQEPAPKKPAPEAAAQPRPRLTPQPKAEAVSEPKPPKASKPKSSPEKPKRSSQEKAEQTAEKGAKSNVRRGRRGGAAGTTGSDSGQSVGRGTQTDPAAESRYLSELQRAIARHRRYPKEAQRRKLEGVATVSFVILADGHIREVRLAKSSGSALLDKAALETLKRLGAFKPIPREIGRTRWRLRVPIRFSLR